MNVFTHYVLFRDLYHRYNVMNLVISGVAVVAVLLLAVAKTEYHRQAAEAEAEAEAMRASEKIN
jgi:hypothetical protein